ncbi:hypothetical protein [uncultured Duncaniella sp.]|uniref:hypothetical protein n=1 Tax=uncultured Duncaniella sp. TaxID=2768039 RepID=UPI0025CBB8A4|nr:hypothetical protein [uncultured Duncaniella sp.]
MKKCVKIIMWVCGGIIGLPILAISILLVIHIAKTLINQDNLSYKEVVSNHPDAEMIYFLGEPRLTHIKDCKLEYVAIENATAYIKIKGQREYNSPLLNIVNDDEGFMFLLDNGETLNVTENPIRFTFIRHGKGNSFSIEKIYTKSSD